MMGNNTNNNDAVPILYIHDQPIFLQEDWESGIGGGLWSTGMAMGHYFGTSHFVDQASSLLLRQRRVGPDRPFRVLELGSGNGFLSVCIAVALTRCQQQKQQQNSCPIQIVATDTSDHLHLMQTTVDKNHSLMMERTTDKDSIPPLDTISIMEYLWGSKEDDSDRIKANDDDAEAIERNASTEGSQHQVLKGQKPSPSSSPRTAFDLVIGSDVAYRDELHDPLIEALRDFSTPTTITLFGVTMIDTKPIFFHKLVQAGFRYEKLADHLLEPTFRGHNFGIFVIQRTNR